MTRHMSPSCQVDTTSPWPPTKERRTLSTSSSTIVTYRPDWPHFWSKAKGRLIVIPVAFLLGGYRLGGAFIPVVLVLIALLGLGLWMYLRTTLITVSDTAVTRRSWGRSIAIQFDGSQRGILCMLNQGVQNLGYLAVRDGTGSRLVLTEAYWPGERLLEIGQRAGVTIVPPDQVLSGKRAAAIEPGVIPLASRRPVLFAFVAVLCLLVVVVTIVIVATKTS